MWLQSAVKLNSASDEHQWMMLWYLGGEDLEVALLGDDGMQEVEVEVVVLP